MGGSSKATSKNITVADFWRGMETNSSRARLLGTYEVLHGDWGMDCPTDLTVEIVDGKGAPVGSLHAGVPWSGAPAELSDNRSIIVQRTRSATGIKDSRRAVS